MSKPLLIIIGADKGGVGKTTVARTILDYFNALDFKFRAFDSETPGGVLKRFFPRDTDIIDLGNVKDQMKVFDTLSVDHITVIDVTAGALTPAIDTLGTVGLFDLVKAGDIELVVMHVIGASVASLDEVKSLSAKLGGGRHFLVRNHVNGSSFFDWDAGTADAAFKEHGGNVIDIPQLVEMANEHVDRAGVPFRSFVAGKDHDGNNVDNSFTLKGHVKSWLTKCFGELDRLNLNGIVRAART